MWRSQHGPRDFCHGLLGEHDTLSQMKLQSITVSLALCLLLAPRLEAWTGVEETSSSVVLSDALLEWKKDIEAIGWGKVVLARIYKDRERNLIVLPQDTEQRPVLRRYFLNESFLEEFIAMDAVAINYKGAEGRFHFILLNMQREPDWRGHEEALLAHEFGHIWLFAQNYPFPVYDGKGASCLSIVAGDMVQHILIREEIRQRRIVYLPFWIGNLEKALDVLERSDADFPAEVSVCRLASELGQWMDVLLGLSEESWDKYDRFLKAMELRYPELKPSVDQFHGLLIDSDVSDQDVHLKVLQEILMKMYELPDSLSPAGGTLIE